MPAASQENLKCSISLSTLHLKISQTSRETERTSLSVLYASHLELSIASHPAHLIFHLCPSLSAHIRSSQSPANTAACSSLQSTVCSWNSEVKSIYTGTHKTEAGCAVVLKSVCHRLLCPQSKGNLNFIQFSFSKCWL